jgi:hypothetical protein
MPAPRRQNRKYAVVAARQAVRLEGAVAFSVPRIEPTPKKQYDR